MRLLPLMVAEPVVLKVFAERYLLEPPSDSWELTPGPSGRRRWGFSRKWHRFPTVVASEGWTIPGAAGGGHD